MPAVVGITKPKLPIPPIGCPMRNHPAGARSRP